MTDPAKSEPREAQIEELRRRHEAIAFDDDGRPIMGMRVTKRTLCDGEAVLLSNGVAEFFAVAAHAVPALLRRIAELEQRERVLVEALSEDPGKWSFDTLIDIAQLLLDANYPADIFDGSSGDPGPVFVARLREALADLRVALHRSEDTAEAGGA